MKNRLIKFLLVAILYILYNLLKILLFLKNNSKNKKTLQQNAKGLEMSWLPRQDDYRTFCMSDETEKVCRELEERMEFIILLYQLYISLEY